MNLARKVFVKLFQKKINKLKLQKARSLTSPIKLVIGSGYTSYNGWLLSDIENLNITVQKDWARYFEVATISVILAEHVFEHLSPADTDAALVNIYRYLKKGGIFRIAVPDGNHPDPNYIEYVRPGGIGPGAEDHKILYDFQSLSNILRNKGFTVNCLEYFDEQGNFHLNAWTSEQGKIIRSALNDNRNSDGTLAYSSLIIDAVK